jgi:CelD/BcsL family acetyltransferase involved in cellulose biosynthesis
MGVTEPAAAERIATSAAVGGQTWGGESQDEVVSPSVGLTCDIVNTVAGVGALKADYERLYQAAGNSLPFALQEWHLAWWEHFLNRSPHIQEQPLFCVVRNGGGESVGLVPLILSRRRLGPLKVGIVAPIGADPALTEIRNPLVTPGCERPTVRAVHDALARISGWDWIQWSGVSEGLAEALTHETAAQCYEVSEDYILDLPSSWEEFRSGLQRNVRESLRHCYNSLKRDGHAFEFVVAREREQVRQGLDRFLELHAMRARAARGPKHPDCFAGRAVREFLYDVCGRLAARDAVRLFQLRIGTRIVASRVAFVVGEGIYLYYSGFDPAWARYSIMTTTLAEAFRYAMANGIRTVNLSLGREQSKVRWRPRMVRFYSALVRRESLKSRIVCRAYHAAMIRNGRSARTVRRLFSAARDWD